MYNDFMMHLLKVKNKGIAISDIIKNKNIKNICIYGVGVIGKVLFEELHNTGIDIICFIDKASKSFKFGYADLPVIAPEEINKLTNVDAIIITPYKEYYQITSYLKHFNDCRVLSIRDILSEAMSEQEFIEFSEFLKQKDVKLYLFNRPSVDMINNPSLWEQALWYSNNSIEGYTVNQKEFYEYLYKDEGISDVGSYLRNLQKSGIVLNDNPNSECVIKDLRFPLKNIINGYRFIPEQPKEYENTLYTFGDCSNQIGDDTRTFGNYLQKLINKKVKRRFRVATYNNTIRNISFLFQKVKTLPLRKGDIIVYTDLAFWNRDHNYRFFYNLTNIYSYDLIPDFSRPHDYGEIFYDRMHMTTKGNELLSNAVFKYISENDDFLGDDVAKEWGGGDEFTGDSACLNTYEVVSELQLYQNYLIENKKNLLGKIGSIVMNCNPFTNGHKYIIEYASSKVDFLYVFVVEEDKSFFPFNDRFELVKKGVEHLSNVEVLRSGKFIISTVTFENYFKKEEMPETEIDASEDIKIFATQIAPVLNITVRFAGSEPLCNITRQYNRDMANILPVYGIEFAEVDRVQCNEEYISASSVRELISKNDFGRIKILVPDITYEYLMNVEKNK